MIDIFFVFSLKNSPFSLSFSLSLSQAHPFFREFFRVVNFLTLLYAPNKLKQEKEKQQMFVGQNIEKFVWLQYFFFSLVLET